MLFVGRGQGSMLGHVLGPMFQVRNIEKKKQKKKNTRWCGLKIWCFNIWPHVLLWIRLTQKLESKSQDSLRSPHVMFGMFLMIWQIAKRKIENFLHQNEKSVHIPRRHYQEKTVIHVVWWKTVQGSLRYPSLAKFAISTWQYQPLRSQVKECFLWQGSWVF